MDFMPIFKVMLMLLMYLTDQSREKKVLTGFVDMVNVLWSNLTKPTVISMCVTVKVCAVVRRHVFYEYEML